MAKKCGDSGSLNKRGRPCGMDAGPDGRCEHHPLRPGPAEAAGTPATSAAPAEVEAFPSPTPSPSPPSPAPASWTSGTGASGHLDLGSIEWFGGPEAEPSAGRGGDVASVDEVGDGDELVIEHFDGDEMGGALEALVSGRAGWKAADAGRVVNPLVDRLFERGGKDPQTKDEREFTGDTFAKVFNATLLAKIDPNSPWGALSLWSLMVPGSRYLPDLVDRMMGRSSAPAPAVPSPSPAPPPHANGNGAAAREEAPRGTGGGIMGDMVR